MPVQCSQCQRQFFFFFLLLDVRCAFQVAYSITFSLCLHLWRHLPILHFKCYIYKFPQKPLCFDRRVLSWLRHKSCGPYNRPASQPQGLPAVFLGWPASASTAIHKVCKRFFCMSNFCFPCSSFLSPLLIWIWKCPIAFI